MVGGGNDSVRLPVPHAISFPYAGIIQIRFNGYDLRLCAKPPRVRAVIWSLSKGEQEGCQGPNAGLKLGPNG